MVYTPEDITTRGTKPREEDLFSPGAGHTRLCSIPHALLANLCVIFTVGWVACDTTPPRRNVEARLLHGEEDAQSHMMREYSVSSRRGSYNAAIFGTVTARFCCLMIERTEIGAGGAALSQATYGVSIDRADRLTSENTPV